MPEPKDARPDAPPDEDAELDARRKLAGDLVHLVESGLEAVADTTWQATSGPDAIAAQPLGGTDYHATVADVPQQEYSARGGQWVLTCP